ncbi:glycosyltransferase [Microbacterium sp. H37-C3]|uniref:glycosyltransferase family 2 protein n=1 Tax=Microbacterium sp. H37-C3 TaxID=3004354 RepID=UPI0022AEF5AE|nr:glycosyltransferase [Microbacterium sp. H37-C3]MCZ4067503.1 glycosyltransferase [Microbacterium sp. H37-C3]
MSDMAIVTLCSAPRLEHLRNQLRATAGVPRVVVWIGDDDAPLLDAESVVRVPPGAAGLRLAAARNAGARAAEALGARLLVFLDADCIPGPELVDRYRDAASQHPDAVLCGPVTYLPAGAALDAASLRAATAPHAARPAPPAGTLQRADPADYPLFWSLSFATTTAVWQAVGGFDERYEGYGGEDTDFAFSLRRAGVPMVWVGGADAYHQHHETSSPPWQHLDDILRNGALFAEKWGEWPMTGWLEAFERAGAITRQGDGWRRVAG